MKSQRQCELISVMLALILLLTGCVVPTLSPAVVTDVNDTDELRVSTLEVPTSLDPARAFPHSRTSSMVLRALYQTLVIAPTDPSADVEPDLALSWEINDNWTEIVFQLDPTATFTDGTSVTADDVVFSIARMKGIGGLPAYLADTIDVEATEVLDDQTVKLVLTQPDQAILDKLATTAFSILNAKLVIENGGSPDGDDTAGNFLNTTSVGSGAYVLEEGVPGQQIILVRNDLAPNYLDRMLHRIVIQLGRSPGEQAIQLIGDNTDLALDLTPETVVQIETSSSTSIERTPTLDLFFLQSNRTAWSDEYGDFELIRQAVSLALNREEILPIFDDVAILPASFVPRGFEEALSDSKWQYDPDKAAELVTEAGHDTNKAIPLAYPTSPGIYRQLAEKISADLNAVGLSTVTQPVDTDLGDYPISLSSISPDYLNANTYLDFLPGGFIASQIGWENEELFAIREQILGTPDAGERFQIFQDAQELEMISPIEGGDSPFVFLGQPTTVVGLQRSVVYNHHNLYGLRLSLMKKCPCNRCDRIRDICAHDCTDQCCKKCRCSGASYCGN
jgi:peptide/nickel transport system substrate-binding protein